MFFGHGFSGEKPVQLADVPWPRQRSATVKKNTSFAGEFGRDHENYGMV
jgi:hypothetical protein